MLSCLPPSSYHELLLTTVRICLLYSHTGAGDIRRRPLSLPPGTCLVNYGGENINIVESVVARVHDQLLKAPNDQKYIGFDCEWEFTKGPGGGGPGKIAIVQLCTPSKKEVFVFQVLRLSKRINNMFPKSLKVLLEDDAILKVGAGIAGDVAKMEKDWKVQVSRIHYR